MSLYAFSDSMIASCIRAGDSAKYGIDLKNKRADVVAAIKTRANDLTSAHAPHAIAQFRQRPCVVMNDYPTVMVIRCLTRFLARRFRVRMQSRNDIISTIITTLSDQTPFFIIKRDIRHFYETLNVDFLRNSLLRDQSISNNAQYHLKAFFNEHCTDNIGIPRGVGLSALIGEWSLQDYDKHIRRTRGIYRYFRYCDDILIFSIRPPSEIAAELEMLPSGLHFNIIKQDEIIVDKHHQDFAFNFLGYHFSSSPGGDKKSPRRIKVDISEQATKRIKSKIALSVSSYNADGDFTLLSDRLKYLSGNFRVMRLGVNHNRDAKYIKAGIHYSFKDCGFYEGPRRLAFDSASISSIDTFFHALRKSKRNSISRFFSNSLSSSQHNELAKISFNAGFKTPYFVRFNDSRVGQINQIWKTL